MYTRKRIDIKLPQIVITKIDELCIKKAITRTNYIETLIRMDLKKRNIIIEEQPLKDYGKFEDWGWTEKIKRNKK
jgi:metal-responsive CopG/Arc/MetJ family transcriptional regulator